MTRHFMSSVFCGKEASIGAELFNFQDLLHAREPICHTAGKTRNAS